MGAPKGNKYAKGGGRPKGKPNAATLEFKTAINNLIDFATPQMVGWLEKVASEDGGEAKALELIYKFAQFGYPLLARSEQKVSADVNISIKQFNLGNTDT